MDAETLAQAKEFVSDIRTVSRVGSEDILLSISKLLDGRTKATFDGFRDKINSAGLINGSNPQFLLSALGEAASPIADVLAKTLNGERPTETRSGQIVVASSIQGNSPQRHIYTVKQDVDVCDEGQDTKACVVNVDLVLQLDFPNGPTGAQGNGVTSLNAAGGLRVTITKAVLKNAYVSATVQPVSAGHLQVSGLSFTSDTNAIAGWKDSTALSLNFSNLALNLPLTLEQLGTTDPVKADVTVTGKGTSIKVDVGILSRDGESRTAVDVFALQGVELDATAGISDSAQSLQVTKAAVRANGSKVSVDPDPFDDIPAPRVYGFLVETVGKKTTFTTSEETATEFLNASVDVEASATLTGLGPVTVKAAGQRSSNELLSLNPFRVSSDSGELTLSGDIDFEGQLASLDALNDAGFTLDITSASNGSRSGTLLDKSGRKVADVVEENGKLQIRYVDGTSQTL
ncbi:hypothetical protein DWB84_01365 [Saccharophagus sp. K07]|nr:hypothetical protein [Saccharophagus sp. K07]